MIDLSELKTGVKVKIVDKWVGCSHNFDGYMDKYLGTVMTVRGPSNSYSVHMVEDFGENDGVGWFWYPEMIDYIVYDNTALQFDEREFLSMIGGG